MSIQRLAVLIALLATVCGRVVQAQLVAAASDSGREAAAEPTKRNFWQKMAGTSAPDALYLGWATWHLRYPMQGLMNNHFWGATVRGIHGGTFITSHDDRGYALGVQRVLMGGTRGNFSADLGYRFGVVYGYDREFLEIAERWPVIPALTGMVDLSYKKIGVQISYAGIVMMVGGVVRF